VAATLSQARDAFADGEERLLGALSVLAFPLLGQVQAAVIEDDRNSRSGGTVAGDLRGRDVAV
jgi:hypothetical protein